MGQILGVIFDVDGTLYHQRRLHLLMGSRLVMAALAHPIRTWQEIQIVLHYRCAQEWLRKNPQVAAKADAQIERTMSTTGLSRERIKACIDYWMGEVPLRLMPLCVNQHLKRMISQWYKCGIPLGVYSDYPSWDKLKVLGLDSFISMVTYSTDPEVRAFKPDIQGFKVAAAKMKLSPDKIAYVGDRHDTDVVGAQEAGMYPLIVGKTNIEWLDSKLFKIKQ